MSKYFYMSTKIYTSLRDWGKFFVAKFLQLLPKLFDSSLYKLKGEEWILWDLVDKLEMFFFTEAPQGGPFLWREKIGKEIKKKWRHHPSPDPSEVYSDRITCKKWTSLSVCVRRFSSAYLFLISCIFTCRVCREISTWAAASSSWPLISSLNDM